MSTWPPLADVVGEHGLADRDHAGGAEHQGDADHGDPRVVAEQEEAERRDQRAADRQAQQRLAPAAVVGRPAPGVGREQPGRALHRGQHADREGAVAQALVPERRVRAEQADEAEVAEGDRGEGQQGGIVAAARRLRSAHVRIAAPDAMPCSGNPRKVRRRLRRPEEEQRRRLARASSATLTPSCPMASRAAPRR